MIDLADYQSMGEEGFHSEQDGAELIKAMIAGQITGRDTTNQLLTQEPLKAESLEKTLKSLEFRMKDINLWNSIPKLAAYNTVEEYIQLESYGINRGGFYNEGELSDVEDSKYRRRAELVKYIQVTGEVTYQAQIVKSYVDAMRQEVANKTMWIVRKVDQALTKGDASIVGQEFNSLYKQHASIGGGAGDLYVDLDAWMDGADDVVIDLRGAPMTQEILEDAALNIDANFGNIDTFFGPPTMISGLSKDYFQRQRIMLDGRGFGGTIGVNPKAIDTSFGQVNLRQDKFMKKFAPRKTTEPADSAKAPNAPTVSTVALSGTEAGSRFVAGEAHTGALGTVYYAVAAVNRYGESALAVLDTTTSITLTAGESVDVTVVDGGGAVPADGYVLYRSKVTSVTPNSTVLFYPLGIRVSLAELAAGFDGGAATIIRDRNRFLPDAEDGFCIEMDSEIVSFKQLAPISKLNLAILGMSQRFITFLFGTPILYIPKKMIRLLNAGPFVPA